MSTRGRESFIYAWTFLFLATWFSAPAVLALENGLARTPPMGWNSWNAFGCTGLDEKLVVGIAETMVSSGMKEAGYQYVNIDDCWQSHRDSQGIIQADSTKFPHGIKWLADYVHSLGLKIGLYTAVGQQTCAKRPGSYGYEELDARTYANWGVDFLKVDWCTEENFDPKLRFAAFRDALAAVDRPIVLSIANYGVQAPWTWGPEVANMWRTTWDIANCFDCDRGWTRLLDQQVGLEPFAGAGGWNDPDMLQVGNGGMNESEDRAHFTMWSMLAAPLLAGNDLRSMSAATRATLTNKDVIAINQDPAGRQAVKIWSDGAGLEIWTKVLQKSGERAVAFLNRSSQAGRMQVDGRQLGFVSRDIQVEDLWRGQNLGVFKQSFTATVASHDVVLLKVRGEALEVCSNFAPSPSFTCSEQAKWGKCGEDWMLDFCHQSCGRC